MVNATVASNVTRSAIKSFYRPFGNLPTDMDIDNADQVWAIFGASCACVALAVFSGLCILGVLCKYQTTLKEKFTHRIVIFMMIGSCFTTAMGLVGMADAITQYPDAQSPYGHAFERISVIGLMAFFLPALYFRPIAARVDLEAEPLRTKITVIVSGGVSGVIMAFTIASLCLKKIPFELLITTMAIELVGVMLQACVGIWIMIGVKRDQSEGLSENRERDNFLTPNGGRFTSKIEFLKRLMFLGWGIFVSLIYIVVINVESPLALYARGAQTVMLFIHLCTMVFFAWCHFITFLACLKQAKITPRESPLGKLLEGFCHIKLENGTTTGTNVPIVKSKGEYTLLPTEKYDQ